MKVNCKFALLEELLLPRTVKILMMLPGLQVKKEPKKKKQVVISFLFLNLIWISIKPIKTCSKNQSENL